MYSVSGLSQKSDLQLVSAGVPSKDDDFWLQMLKRTHACSHARKAILILNMGMSARRVKVQVAAPLKRAKMCVLLRCRILKRTHACSHACKAIRNLSMGMSARRVKIQVAAP